MKVRIDPQRCIGCGMCAAAVPEVFRMTGVRSSVAAEPAPSQVFRVQDAANGCPVNAIQIRHPEKKRENF